MRNRVIINAEKLVGRRVEVVSNSERRIEKSHVGECGRVVKNKLGDCMVRFDSGCTDYIYVKDLVVSK